MYPTFGIFAESEIPFTVRLEDFAWLDSRNFTRKPESQVQEEPAQGDEGYCCTPEQEQESARGGHVPVWSAYNSLINNMMPVTRVGTLPFIAAPAHQWQTLLTILTQAQNINTKIVGPEKKTVISLDLGLYQPAKKLQMAQNDLNHLILRPGELHIVMAQLHSIGKFIENSGLDMCWTE